MVDAFEPSKLDVLGMILPPLPLCSGRIVNRVTTRSLHLVDLSVGLRPGRSSRVRQVVVPAVRAVRAEGLGGAALCMRLSCEGA